MLDPALAREPYCYLTTAGRVSGRPHTIEIWFALEGATLYLLAGGRDRSDWVRNARRDPAVCVRIGAQQFAGTAREPAPGSREDRRARRLLLAKYAPGYADDLSEWGRDALAVAVDLADGAEPGTVPQRRARRR